MNRIGLKVNGIWCVLPQDVSISIEEQNPLFSDSGSYSYPIELSVSQNRELFKSIDSTHGRIRPQDIDGLPFELWFEGNMLLSGSVETDEDLDIDEDKCSINLVSGNGDFKSKIDGMQCTDVPLLGDIYLGDFYPGFTGMARDEEGHTGWLKFEALLHPSNNMDFKEYNVSEAFPQKPYCNIRVCVKKKDQGDLALNSPYQVLEADRPWSGVCFYVAYFYKCLFAHLGYAEGDDHMCDVDDMKRLAFVTTKCEHRLGEKKYLSESREQLKVGRYIDASLRFDDVKTEMDRIAYQPVYASEKNFPETDVSSVVDSMFNAFGLKIVIDEKNGKFSVFYMRDVLRDNEVIDVNMHVRNKQVSYSKIDGVKLTYGNSGDDTAYDYNDYNGAIQVLSRYGHLATMNLSAYDKTLYVISETGNKYRIKIDGDAEKEGDVKKLHPAIFEVGQFEDYVVGKDSENTEELKLSFTPLIENDIRSKYLVQNSATQELALFIDGAETEKPGKTSERVFGGSFKYGPFNTFNHTWFIDLHQNLLINWENDTSEDPITAHDCGFMLGVMRGPGSKSGYAVQIEDYDGNGNDAWVTVEDDYAFTADSIDAYGNHYDYNGDSEGGVASLADTISLKTHIRTAQELGLKDVDGNDIDWGIDAKAAKRGLADRFMSEYMHFLLHRKTVSMDADTTLSQLTSLSWFKQLRISETVGRLKSRSYTITNSGVTDMGIELYTIN